MNQLRQQPVAVSQMGFPGGYQAVGGTVQATEGKQFILVKHDYRTLKIAIDEVLYFEGKGNYVSIFMKEGVIVTLLTMGKLEQVLEPYGFFRIHKSYIVAFRFIEAFWNDKVQVRGKQIPIGGQYREKFQEYLNRYSIAVF